MIVELFAGAGGATLGIHRVPSPDRAQVLAVERDPDAAATLRACGLVGTVVEADIHDVMSSLPTSGVCLLWASPPCQPYSRAGKRRGSADARDCWPVTLAAIDRCASECVIIENVRGSPAEAWAAQLALLGYWSAVWDLDAADFGVPQRRHRRFVVARLDGRPVAPPNATHSRAALDAAKASGEYAAQVEAGTLGLDTLATRDMLGRRPWNTIRAALPGTALPHVEAREPWRLDLPSPCVAATEEKGAGARSVACHRTGQHVGHGLDRASDALLLATGRRRLTPMECAALQGFPADWPWSSRTKSSHYRQVGNAVPPPLAEAVVRAATTNISADPTVSGKEQK